MSRAKLFTPFTCNFHYYYYSLRIVVNFLLPLFTYPTAQHKWWIYLCGRGLCRTTSVCQESVNGLIWERGYYLWGMGIFKKKTLGDLYHYRVVVYTLPRHISVQTTCKNLFCIRWPLLYTSKSILCKVSERCYNLTYFNILTYFVKWNELK